MRGSWIRACLCLCCSLSGSHAQTADSGAILTDRLNEPSWLRFRAFYRVRLEGASSTNYQAESSDYYVLQRARLEMTVRPVSWLKFNFGAQDARVWGKDQRPPAPPYQDTLDLRIASVDLGSLEEGRGGVRFGRQELVFGDKRVLGQSDWSNTARSWDGIRGRWRYHRLHVDAFSARVIEQRDGEFDRSITGNKLHGLYGGLENVIPHSTLEPYFLWRQALAVKLERGGSARPEFGVLGARWAGRQGALDYNVETVLQRGSAGRDRIRAWAGHWEVDRHFGSRASGPLLRTEYNYSSGDEDPADGIRGTFDRLFATAHDKHGLADLVGWRNLHHVRGALDWKMPAHFQFTTAYSSFWLASARDGLYNSNGNLVAIQRDGSAGRHVGQEMDFLFLRKLPSGTTLGAGFARMFPGGFLRKATAGAGCNAPLLFLSTQL